MTAIHWKNAVSGNFNLATNWNPAAIPGAADTALIDANGTYTVTSAVNNTVFSLNTIVTATLAITANTFTLTHDSDNVGTISLANGASFVTGAAGIALGLFNSGSLKLNATATATSWKIAGTKLTLSGAGNVLLSASANNAIVSGGAAAIFDNVDNTITGGGTIGDTHLTLVNESAGVINANGTVKLIIGTGTNAIANAGLIATTNTGGLQINSNLVNDGSLVASKGALLINAATVTGAGTISTTVSGAHIDLSNAGIVFGGTISTVAGSQINALAGTIDRIDAKNFSNAGSIVIADNSALLMGGILDNTGTLSINGGADATALEIDAPTLRLTGNGQVTLADSAQNFIISAGGHVTLENRGNTISGAGTIGDGNLCLLNQSLINANATNALIINGSTGPNQNFNGGVIETTGSGGLTITGTLVNTGTLTAAGSGTLLLSGANITSGVVQATTSGARIDLQNAQINLAKVTTAAGSTLTALANTVDSIGGNAIKNAGAIVVADKATLHVTNAYVNNSGTVSVAGATGATKNIITGYERLIGNGQFTLSDNVNNSIVSDGSSATFVNFGNNITGAGTIGDGMLQLRNQAGSIDANGAKSLVIAALNDPNAFDLNNGLIETTGAGGLKLFAAMQNHGTLMAAGSGGLLVANVVINDGETSAATSGAHIDLQGGSIFDGTLSTVVGSMVDTVAGTTNTLDIVDFRNAGSLVINDKSFLNFGSYVENSGTIKLNGSTGVTTLAIDDFGSALTGGGTLVMTNSVNNKIVASGTATNATTTATIGGTEKNGDVLSFTFTNANLNGFPVTVSLTTAGNETLAAIAAGLTAAINANALLHAAAITASTAGAVITIKQPGDLGNKTFVSSTLSSGSTETVTFGTGGGQLQGGTSPSLYNEDNIISGAGTIGDRTLVVNNGVNGVINANGSAALIINSSANDDFNGGLIETTNTGGLTVIGTLVNTARMIAAKGGLLFKSALIDNAGGTIAATVSAAHIDLSTATIRGGNVSTVVGTKLNVIAGTTDTLDAATNNAGAIVIANKSTLILGDSIVNTGSILLTATANATTVRVNSDGVDLRGHGRVTLSNVALNSIVSNGAPAQLRNYDNLISGAGTIGDANLTLQNQAGAVIAATGTNALNINTGANVVSNAGTIESIASGGLTVTGTLVNQGVLLASVGTLKVGGAVTGNGVTKLSGAGIVEFAAASNQTVAFAAGSTGTLRLDTSTAAASHFTGTVSGLTASNALDFSDIGFGVGTVATFAGTSTHGVLTVTDGTHVSTVNLKGNYLSSTFTTSSDGHGGTKVVDPPAGSGGAPHAMMAAAPSSPSAGQAFVVEPSMVNTSFGGSSGYAPAPQILSGLSELVHSLSQTHAGIAPDPLSITTVGHVDNDLAAALANGKGAFSLHG